MSIPSSSDKIHHKPSVHVENAHVSIVCHIYNL